MTFIYLDEFFYCDNLEIMKDIVKQHIKHTNYHKLNMKELETNILKLDPHPHGWYRKFEKKRF